MRVQITDNAALEKLMQGADKYVLPGTIQVSVLEVQLSYMTRRENIKDKNCYCLVPTNRVYAGEYLDFFSDDIEKSFKDKNPWVTNIDVFSVEEAGSIFFNEKSIANSLYASNILDIAAGDDQNGQLLSCLRQDVHYKNLLYKDLSLPIQRVDFSYETMRGNKREDFRLLFADSLEKIKTSLLDRILELNKKAPYKALLNVQILNSVCSGVIRAV